MWPSKHGLGAQIGYGVKGSAIIDSSDQRRLPQIVFASLDDDYEDQNVGLLSQNDTIPSLKTVKLSFQTVVEPQTSNFDLNSSIYNDLQSDFADKVFIPQDILKSYLIELGSLTSTIAYDPTVGSRFCIISLPSRHSSLEVVVYTSSELGTVLNLATMKMSCDTSDDTFRLTNPVFGTPFQLTFPEAINQISSSATSHKLIIRTVSKVYVVQPRISTLHLSGLHLDLLGQIESTSLKKESFADACFNPCDEKQVGLIDIKGNFGVWNFGISSTSTPKRVDIAASDSSINNPQELSHWKKICFFSPRVLHAFSRSSMTQCSLGPPSRSFRLVTANTWSSILDFQRNSEVLKFSFMLTSKELIWFENTDKLKRLLSIKHFLDDKDPSWKLNVCSVDSLTFVCVAFSQKAPLYFFYTLGLRDGVPHSLKKPYYIRSLSSYHQAPKDNVLQLHLFPVSGSKSKIFGLFELRTDFSLSFRFLSTTKSLTLQESRIDTIWSRSGTPVETGSSACKQLPMTQWKRLMEKISKKLLPNDTSDSTIIQKFALQIGEWSLTFKEDKIRHENPSCVSLLDLTKNTPTNVQDIGEFDSMIDQSSDYFNNHNIEVLRDSDDSLQQQFKLLEGYYGCLQLTKVNTAESIRRAALELGCSKHKLKHGSTNQVYEEKLKELLHDVDQETQKILGDWGEDIVDADITTQADPNIPESFPTINVNSSQVLSTVMPPISQGTQMNSQLHSQAIRSQKRSKMSQGSQRSQRKKKKGGFA